MGIGNIDAIRKKTVNKCYKYIKLKETFTSVYLSREAGNNGCGNAHALVYKLNIVGENQFYRYNLEYINRNSDT